MSARREHDVTFSQRRLYILEAMLRAEGNKEKAAKYMEISRFTLYRWLTRLQAIDDADPAFIAWSLTNPEV